MTKLSEQGKTNVENELESMHDAKRSMWKIELRAGDIIKHWDSYDFVDNIAEMSNELDLAQAWVNNRIEELETELKNG